MKNFKLLMITDSFKNDCNIFVSTLMQTYIGQEFGFCELLETVETRMVDRFDQLPTWQATAASRADCLILFYE